MAFNEQYGKLGMTGGFYPLANFPLVDSNAVYVDPNILQIEGQRLDATLALLINQIRLLNQFNEDLIPIFVGTKSEYDSKDAAGEIQVGTIVIITDDIGTNSGSITATLGRAVLGMMKLGQL